MNWIITKNNKSVKAKDIPQVSMDVLRREGIEHFRNGKRVIAFFGVKNKDKVILYIVMADDENSRLFVSSSVFDKEKSYQSITTEAPVFHIFEREFYEDFGIVPLNHPWLKPVRYSFNRANPSNKIENYPFFSMEGDEIHEVAVGPVHAGIIEPGHFRFMCHGENVYHLEIQLGYQHRGVEALFAEKKNPVLLHNFAESITGDSVIAHTTAYVNAIESLSNTEIPRKAMAIRAIALELERVAIHIGDLGAIANDIAYLTGSAVYGATRTLVINSLLAICGSRFGKGLIRAGGVNFDIDLKLAGQLKTTLDKVYKDVELMSETMLSQASVLSRVEKTGIVEMEKALEIGMVGPAARASGVAIDVRQDHPYGMYLYSSVHKISLQSGDVFARAYIRYVEIKQSIRFILEQLDGLSEENNISNKVGALSSESFVVSMTEGWRGEVVHTVITDKEGNISRYKIKDPSFNNWYGLALAVRDNGVSDFPLCNKSFNLSYCGNDL
jgi:Ni,Fe-hydrogenase III large subunit